MNNLLIDNGKGDVYDNERSNANSKNPQTKGGL
jgi:hypothetical protein